MFARTTRFAELPDVPTGRELTKDPKALRLLDFAEAPFFMALPLVAPPGSAGRPRHALQAAFMAMTKDPAFVAEAKKMSLELSPIDGEAVRKVIAQMQATPPDVIAQFKAIAARRISDFAPTRLRSQKREHAHQHRRQPEPGQRIAEDGRCAA